MAPKKEKRDKPMHRCEDCGYTTTKKCDLNKHRPGNKCRQKTKQELKEKNQEKAAEKEKERKERHREANRAYDERKRKAAKFAEATAKIKELKAEEQKKRDLELCPSVYKN